jgi:hypothetical protein
MEERVWERDPLCDVCGGSDRRVGRRLTASSTGSVASSELHLVTFHRHELLGRTACNSGPVVPGQW